MGGDPIGEGARYLQKLLALESTKPGQRYTPQLKKPELRMSEVRPRPSVHPLSIGDLVHFPFALRTLNFHEAEPRGNLAG